MITLRFRTMFGVVEIKKFENAVVPVIGDDVYIEKYEVYTRVISRTLTYKDDGDTIVEMECE
jgi:hypothetical protein